MTRDILIQYYLSVMLSIKSAHVNGKPVLAKPALLVSTIDCIAQKKVSGNKISINDLKETYSNTCDGFRCKETPMSYPYYFMDSEKFWHLKWNCEPVKTKAPSEKMIRDRVDYAYLDNALWDLLQDAENRRYFRDAIVNHFFRDNEESATTEKGDDNNMEEATPRQLWALKRATGVDYRGRGLTKQEASEMIAESMKKAEEQGVDLSSTGATPRQLRYLERATGIDYSSKGLTKTEATRMIRDIKEAEADDADEINPEEATDRQLRYLKKATGIDYSDKNLTKQQASKLIKECKQEEEEAQSKTQTRRQPAPEPGTLEYVLSKCKTREEQLEAARKFFGEDK